MFRKIIYVFLGFFATVFALNVETGFNDGIMNVTLYEVEGLAQGECGDNGFTECPDRGSTLISCVIKDPVTHETAPSVFPGAEVFPFFLPAEYRKLLSSLFSSKFSASSLVKTSMAFSGRA